MKKLSVILLALAIAAFAVPAMAGEVTMDGEYTVGGFSESNGSDSAMFEHELDLNIDVTSGDVSFHWDVELSEGAFDTDVADNDAAGVYDAFYVKWQATDALATKIGVYAAVSDTNTLVFDAAGHRQGTIGILYSLDAADLGFYLSKDQDNDEDDVTDMFLTASGEAGPAELGFTYGSRTDDTGGDEFSSMAFDVGFDAGPVGVAFAYASVSSDVTVDDGGTAMVVDLGLEELVGFDLTATVIQTNEDWNDQPFGNDYGYAKILDYDDAPDLQVFGIAGGYEYNDNLSFSALAVLLCDVDGDSGPTEIDVALAYSLADNVGYEAGYAAVSEGDVGPADATKMWHEIVFEF